ncbi:hypothetical protein BJ085DRAFT_28196 [Dimargaris cristalligena]|uniref:F-box domain-containing protein n=1 Tax=Dimargaris cristalligena TaxID=215637 RepID=A0A4Q0A294_9FUNG|nr:hypothetical protein BJ085DRAFT_28196 [Dimargaris cristalligena]|eukprot:RKP40177.1 hypothetical protein BJ085DRAFT_28196 [Dimargaris cristalligena]
MKPYLVPITLLGLALACSVTGRPQPADLGEVSGYETQLGNNTSDYGNNSDDDDFDNFDDDFDNFDDDFDDFNDDFDDFDDSVAEPPKTRAPQNNPINRLSFLPREVFYNVLDYLPPNDRYELSEVDDKSNYLSNLHKPTHVILQVTRPWSNYVYSYSTSMPID